MDWWLLLFIPLLVFFNIRFRQKVKLKNNKRRKSVEMESRAKAFSQLRSLITYNKDGYKGETKEKIKSFEESISEIIERSTGENKLSTQEVTEKATEIAQKYREFEKELKDRIISWEEIKNESDKVVDEAILLIDGTNFYPHDFIYHINTTKINREKAVEAYRKNPFESFDEARTKLDDFKWKLDTFKKLHKEIIENIEKLNAIEYRLEENQREKIVLLRNDLFMAMQRGDLEKAIIFNKDFSEFVS